MEKVIYIRTIDGIIEFYGIFFYNILSGAQEVLYVGFEEDDIILSLLDKLAIHITAIDREERKILGYKNVKALKMDYLDYIKEDDKKFDFAILSFVLHENDFDKQRKMIKKSVGQANFVVVIEPIKRNDINGIQFEKEIKDYLGKVNIIKVYQTAEYWQRLISEESEKTCKSIIIKRNKFEYESLGNGVFAMGMEKISLQDIIITSNYDIT